MSDETAGEGTVEPRIEAEAVAARARPSARDDVIARNARDLPRDAEGKPVAIRVRDLTVGFGEKIIMDGLNLDVRAGEVLGFVGASGAGKSVLTRTILGLVKKRSGSIEVLGETLDRLDVAQRREIEKRWGCLLYTSRCV